ncbi:hypothetical protein MJO28_004242 [Puccinia striiformis f. sp. tritici]|uniref:Uncharacterized protein n=1 Tax=Puccinia striiformis f. sp. tritici TaxID=168172 RepID=A0ACC0ERW9_9BASI|nr:hypothetical protein MJO28_004242 [Puccinia striiformis f. sp. tritici]
MILDQDSLEVDRQDQEVELDEMEVVEESDATRLVNSNTWSKSIRGRTRRQIRLKWNKEEKKSPEDIIRALLDQPPNQSQGEGQGQAKDEEEEIEKLVIPSHLTNFDQYTRIVGIDCTGPIPKSDGQGSGPIDLVDNDDEEEDDLVIEENLGGWQQTVQASQQQQQLPTPPATAGLDGPLIIAAWKMKLKAQAVKAEQAVEKMTNPSAADLDVPVPTNTNTNTNMNPPTPATTTTTTTNQEEKQRAMNKKNKAQKITTASINAEEEEGGGDISIEKINTKVNARAIKLKGGSRQFKPVNRTAASQQQQQLPTPPGTAGTDGPLMSAAEKMKLKARAAKAERAAEKLRNPSAAGSRRSTSVLTDTTSLGTKQPQQEDINVLHSHQQKAWSPPIDPLLDIAAFVDGVLQPTQDLDIPVPTNTNTNPPPPATTTTAKSQLPIKKKKQRAMVIRDQLDEPIDNQLENEQEEEDISPRLKRKRHLEQSRKNKKNKAQKITTTSINADDEEEGGDVSIEKINAKVNARAIKRRSNTQNGTTKKKQKCNTTEETIDEEEEEEDEVLDPSKVSMASLTNPNRSKGQSSEVLDKRLQLIIERRDREKQERSLARLESKRKSKLVLINRVKDVKARQVKFQELGGSEVGDNGSVVDKSDKNDKDIGQQGEDDEERDIDWAGDDNSTSIKENQKQKIIDEYGLDELNSDEDFEDFEEVEYDQFASSKNKKKTTQQQQEKESSTPQQTTTVDNNDDEEEEEEEVVEEDFNVDDYVPQASLYAPQLRVVNGQMILDQDSLEVDRRDQEVELDEMEVVEESDATRLVNSNTWSKSIRGERWTVNDTGLFYDAVRLFGSDFEMISQLFPGRTRRQIRLKWNKEEKKSPEEITRALLGKKPIREETPLEEELETISEDPLEDQPPNQSPSQGEGEGQAKDEEEEIEKLVIPSHLTDFDQYARIVGIDCTGPIPVDPMDKWREKERLEFKQLQASTDKLKKSDEQGSGLMDLVDNDDDEEDDLVIEENFGGWEHSPSL